LIRAKVRELPYSVLAPGGVPRASFASARFAEVVSNEATAPAPPAAASHSLSLVKKRTPAAAGPAKNPPVRDGSAHRCSRIAEGRRMFVHRVIWCVAIPSRVALPRGASATWGVAEAV